MGWFIIFTPRTFSGKIFWGFVCTGERTAGHVGDRWFRISALKRLSIK